MKKTAIIIGANSDIAFELSKLLISHHYKLVLLSRNLEELKKKKIILNEKPNSEIVIEEFDICNYRLNKDKLVKYSDAELLIIASGYLNINNRKDEKMMQINYVAPREIITTLINSDQHNIKEILCFTSVSGDRIDAYNNQYSKSKKNLSDFIYQKKESLLKKNIYLKDLKLGYVNTKMTKHIFLQNFFCKPVKKVAINIFNNIGLKNNNVIYYPKIWILILMIYNFFKKINPFSKKYDYK